MSQRSQDTKLALGESIEAQTIQRKKSYTTTASYAIPAVGIILLLILFTSLRNLLPARECHASKPLTDVAKEAENADVMVPLWEYKGYAQYAGGACGGRSWNTGSIANMGCTASGFTMNCFSGTGAGTFKICFYSTADCSNAAIGSLNGGTVANIQQNNMMAIRVVGVNANCP